MSLQLRACVLAALSLPLLVARPAAAQDVPRPVIVAPYEVAAALRSLGLRPTASPRPRGDFWIAPAVDPRGMQVRVVVEAGTGEILSVDEIGPAPLRPRRPIAAVPQGPRVVMRDGTQQLTPPADIDPDFDAVDEFDRETPSRPRANQTPSPPRPRATVPAPQVATRPADPKPRTAPLPRPRPSSEITAAPGTPATPAKDAARVPQDAPAPASPTPAQPAWPPAQGLE